MRRVVHLWQAGYPWEVRVGKITRSLLKAGCESLILARRGPGEPVRAREGATSIRRVGLAGVRPASMPLPGNPLWAHDLSEAIGEFKPDLLIVRDLPLAWTAAKAGRRFGLPVVLDMAEHYPEAMRSWKKYSENPILKKIVHDWRIPDRVEAAVVPQMDGIVVVCDEQKERLIREYALPAERICVVRNTPEKTFRSGGDAGVADWPPVPSKEKRQRFGYLGILCEDRELETVLRGFDLAAGRNPGISLLIAGGGESEQSLRALTSTLASRDRIRFTGRFRPEDQSKLYSEIDFGIVSLRQTPFTEQTLANKFFDYAALGKPFLYTSLRPLERVMARMNCAVGFVPGSPESVALGFEKLLAGDYEALGRKGLEAIEREFNWEADAARLTEFLAGLPRKSS